MSEFDEWRAILTGLLNVTLHCTTRGPPLQGDPRNGNFPGTREHLTEQRMNIYRELKRFNQKGSACKSSLITRHGRARMNELNCVQERFRISYMKNDNKQSTTP